MATTIEENKMTLLSIKKEEIEYDSLKLALIMGGTYIGKASRNEKQI